MRNFMPEDGGKTCLVLRNRQNARVYDNLSPGEAKGVLCRVLNHRDLPMIPLGTRVDNPHQSGGYAPDKVINGAGLDDAGMADNLTKLWSPNCCSCVSDRPTWALRPVSGLTKVSDVR
jgi:hypothetical protein